MARPPQADSPFLQACHAEVPLFVFTSYSNFQITKTSPPRVGHSKSRDESHLSWISSQPLSKEPRTRGKGRGCDDSPSRFPALADPLINKLHTSRNSYYKTGFLRLGRTDVGSGSFLSRGRSVHHRVFTSVYGPTDQALVATPSCDNQTVSGHCQTSSK